jgi:hypothetical protein
MRGQPLRLYEMIERPSPSSEKKFGTRRGVRRCQARSGKTLFFCLRVTRQQSAISPSDMAKLPSHLAIFMRAATFFGRRQKWHVIFRSIQIFNY